MKYVWKIVTIVEHGLGEKIAAVTRDAGARGGTIIVGRGELDSPILRALALADVERDMLITLVTDEELEPVFHAIVNARLFRRGKKSRSGETCVVPMGGRNMTSENEYEMISVIVNRGYADDIMNAARKAGAKGGTIFNARGYRQERRRKILRHHRRPRKGRTRDSRRKRNTAPAILEAIEKLPCLTTPGIGIMFETPVSRFVTLGGKAKK